MGDRTEARRQEGEALSRTTALLDCSTSRLLDSFDVARARRETPGCERVLHFNNAGAALMPRPVLDATRDYLTLEAEIGGYEAAAQEEAALERFYDAAAALLGCGRD